MQATSNADYLHLKVNMENQEEDHRTFETHRRYRGKHLVTERASCCMEHYISLKRQYACTPACFNFRTSKQCLGLQAVVVMNILESAKDHDFAKLDKVQDGVDAGERGSKEGIGGTMESTEQTREERDQKVIAESVTTDLDRKVTLETVFEW